MNKDREVQSCSYWWSQGESSLSSSEMRYLTKPACHKFTEFIEWKSPSSLSSYTLNLQHYQETGYGHNTCSTWTSMKEGNSVTSEETCFPTAFYQRVTSVDKNVPNTTVCSGTKRQVSALTKDTIQNPTSRRHHMWRPCARKSMGYKATPDPPTLKEYSRVPQTGEMKRSFNTCLS